jgi:hypothetical protein
LESTQREKLRDNPLLCDTLTIDLESVTELTFNGLGDFTGEDDFTILETRVHTFIYREVMIANSIETIINNSIALLIVFECKCLGEFDAFEEVGYVHTIGTL